MNELMLFGSAFGVVFALGFQSLNVNAGHFKLAMLTSFLIGSFNLALYKLAPHVSTFTEGLCYLTGGPIGIVCAMWMHRNVVGPWMKRQKDGKASV